MIQFSDLALRNVGNLRCSSFPSCARPRTFLLVRSRTTPHEPRLAAGTNLRLPANRCPNRITPAYRPVAAPWISRLFWIAGIYGVIVVVPLYFLEHRVGRDYPPPITHAEFLYAFAGVGLAWQIAFFIIATDPARYRLIMIPSALEKFSFAGAIAVLFAQGRVPMPLCAFAAIDLALGILFLIAFAQLKPSSTHLAPAN